VNGPRKESRTARKEDLEGQKEVGKYGNYW